MELEATTPTKLSIRNPSEKDVVELKKHLQYIDKKVDQEIARLKNAVYYNGSDPEYQEKLAALKLARVKSLLFQEKDGSYFTHSGLQTKLSRLMNCPPNKSSFELPERRSIAWETVPEKQPRPYQTEMLSKLLEVSHGAVEVSTGLGKCFVVMMLCKVLALKTVVMAPSISIAEQLYTDFLKHFGKRKVGRFFAGKKESDKLFVIAVAASLTKVEEGTEAFDALQLSKVLLVDESHLVAAFTLAKVCQGLFGDVPYRYFFSGTQIRQDGLELLLEGIIGPVVFEMTVKEGVDQGYLAKPLFRMIKMLSHSTYQSKDANKMTRKHLYYNPNVNRIAGSLASKMVDSGKQVLILIDEMAQFNSLLPFFRHPAAFAHGGVTVDNKDSVPKDYHDSDPNALVKKFNDGKIQILVGTSCIATGTDIRNNKVSIYLVGGKSEIAVRQGAIGRSTRLVESIGKTSCAIFDFAITNIPVLNRHAEERSKIYKETYDTYQELDGERL